MQEGDAVIRLVFRLAEMACQINDKSRAAGIVIGSVKGVIFPELAQMLIMSGKHNETVRMALAWNKGADVLGVILRLKTLVQRDGHLARHFFQS